MLASKFWPCVLAGVLLLTLCGSAGAQDFESWGETFDVAPWFNAPPTRVWGGVDLLLWWRRGQTTPPLVTTSADPGAVANPPAGAIGNPSTQILFGGDPLRTNARAGGRVNLGIWFDPYETVGIEGSFWALGRQTTRFHLESDSSTFLGIPFNDVLGPNVIVVADGLGLPPLAPGQAGIVDIRQTSDILGGDLFFRGALVRDRGVRIDWLAGYQNAVINESLTLTANVDTGQINGPQFDVQDQFLTKNCFNAGSLGLSGSMRRGDWTWDVLAKCGLGNMRQQVTISGNNTAGATGLFAQATNSGTFTRDLFAVAPEAGLKLAYNFNPFARVSFGYSFLYYSSVVQPGNQIDPTVDPVNLGQPVFAFNANGYWVQGLNLGVDWRY